MNDIDFVVTWVDGNDDKWLNKRKKYSPKYGILNEESRFRDYSTFRYWFRSVEKFAPWVHKIFLITDGQLPDWINTSYDKLEVINHTDFISSKYLPTFNSNVIELCIGKIDDLSEKFVIFNDDTFLNKKTIPEDFFIDNLPRDEAILSPIFPESDFDYIRMNNVKVINKYFNKKRFVMNNLHKYFSLDYGRDNLFNLLNLPYSRFSGFKDFHLPMPYLKDTFREVYSVIPDELKETLTHKFREKSDLSVWLMRYWRLVEGKFTPQENKFGKFYWISQISDVVIDIKKNRHKLICVNDEDSINDIDALTSIIRKVLQNKFPQKSKFEI